MEVSNIERYENLYYSITETGINIIGCKITHTGGLVIPETINDISVTSISAKAFKDCDKITSISIPETISTIGAYAFNECYSLESINIPQGITTICEGCFKGCVSLQTINLNNITNINSFAFENCLSLDVELPSNLTFLGERSFHHSGLTNIVIPTSLITIEAGALNWCDSLKGISSNNDNFIIEDNVLYNSDKTELILYPAFKTDITFTIPETVTTIGMYAFEENLYMEKVRIPYDIITIESLCGLINIKEFEIYNGNEIVMNSNNNYLSFYTNSQTGKQYLIQNNEYILKVPIDETIVEFGNNTKIMPGVFAGCKDLESIKTTNNVLNCMVAYKCCYKCSKVKELFFKTVPFSEMFFIGEYAFAECYNVQSITISPVTILNSSFGHISIDEYAFYNCSQLNIFTHPLGNVEENIPLSYLESYYKNASIQVQSHAFENCSQLTTLKMPLRITTASCFSFKNAPIATETGNCICVDGLVICIKPCEYEIEVPMSDNYTLDKILTLQPNIISIKLGSGITKIYDGMFSDDRKDKFSCLESLILPDTLENIGHYSFYMTTIKNIDMSVCNIKTVGAYAFYKYDKGLNINLNNIEHIYSYAFNYTIFTNQTDISIINKESSVTIDYYAFAYCKNIENINIDCKVFKLGLESGNITFDGKYLTGNISFNGAYYTGNSFYRSELISFKASADSYYKSGDDIFESCTCLEELLIQSDVTICNGDYFASNCHNLKKVIHSGNLGRCDYYNCYLLNNFQIYGNVNNIGSSDSSYCYIFDNCYLLRTLDLSNTQITVTSLNFDRQLCVPCLSELKLSPNMKTVIISGDYSLQTLNKLYVPEGVENLIIGTSNHCFQSLIDITIPSTLKTLTLYSGVRKISVPKTCTVALRYLDRGLVDVNYY